MRRQSPIPTFDGNLNHPAAVRRRALYTHLCRLAEAGEQCPGNAELARVSGYKSPGSITEALSILRWEDLIEVERKIWGLRIVTILGTGQRTAEPQPAPAPPFQPKRPVREIASTAIELSGRPKRDIFSRSRFREHVRVRQVIFEFSAREGWPLTHAARIMGFDHTTAAHARKVLPEYVAKEPETAALIEAMARELPPLAMVYPA